MHTCWHEGDQTDIFPDPLSCHTIDFKSSQRRTLHVVYPETSCASLHEQTHVQLHLRMYKKYHHPWLVRCGHVLLQPPSFRQCNALSHSSASLCVLSDQDSFGASTATTHAATLFRYSHSLACWEHCNLSRIGRKGMLALTLNTWTRDAGSTIPDISDCCVILCCRDCLAQAAVDGKALHALHDLPMEILDVKQQAGVPERSCQHYRLHGHYLPSFLSPLYTANRSVHCEMQSCSQSRLKTKN